MIFLQTILWLNLEAAMKSSHSQSAGVKVDINQWGDEKKWKVSSGGVELNVKVSSLTPEKYSILIIYTNSAIKKRYEPDFKFY